jgi:RimJ/RimL family protein N-acetyltransferase
VTIELETERLILRPISAADFEPHAAMMADARVARFLSVDRAPLSRAGAWRQLALYVGHWTIRGCGFFSVYEKAAGGREIGRWVGRVGPWMPEGWPALEIGWGIAPADWGRGFAAEAAAASMRWAFARDPALGRLISLIDPENAQSQAVARKLGEARTGETFRFDDKITLEVWAIGRDAFARRWG